ncbi:unnamed protein product [Lathyrus sativus]|nr:unnamed protein product [Lathyrus sativus]
MDVNFVIESGESFTLELNPFNTILEVKEIIQKYLNISIFNQILIFNNEFLNDADIILATDITHFSIIHLRTIPDTRTKNPEPQESSVEAPATQPREPQESSVEAPATQPREPQESPVEAPATQPREAPATPLLNSESRTLSVTMVPRTNRGEGDFMVSEIEPFTKVSDLKMFLESYKKNVVRQDGNYFFVHNREVMYEDRSFQWHGVKEGDKIEIYDGVVDNNYLGDIPIYF